MFLFSANNNGVNDQIQTVEDKSKTTVQDVKWFNLNNQANDHELVYFMLNSKRGLFTYKNRFYRQKNHWH